MHLRPLPTPPPRRHGDDAPATICTAVFEEICVNANGDIVCSSCDVAGERVYGNVFRDRIADVYDGPLYREMREWLLASAPSAWCPAISRQCPRRTTQARADHAPTGRSVKVLKLEPTSHCNLQCPECPVETGFKTDVHLRTTRARRQLPLEVMLDVVSQLPALEAIHYYNFGEPFLHRDSTVFLRAVRKARPEVRLYANTNGVVMTPAQIEAIASEALLDRIVFSIDGARNESYRRYRVGGDFAKAIGKMRRFVESCRRAGVDAGPTATPGRVQTTWQYILFDWNDSDEELAQARALAEEIGVPIDWVITCGESASKRFTPNAPETARLLAGERAFVSPSAPASLVHAGQAQAAAFEAFAHVDVRCDILRGPYGRRRCKAAWRSGAERVAAPRGGVIVFNVTLANRCETGWSQERPDYLRLGVRILSDDRRQVAEHGAIPAPTIGEPGAVVEVALRAPLPQTPGRYKLSVDLVQEHVRWLGSWGSRAIEFAVEVT